MVYQEKHFWPERVGDHFTPVFIESAAGEDT